MQERVDSGLLKYITRHGVEGVTRAHALHAAKATGIAPATASESIDRLVTSGQVEARERINLRNDRPTVETELVAKTQTFKGEVS
jgi:hypothetical protein